MSEFQGHRNPNAPQPQPRTPSRLGLFLAFFKAPVQNSLLWIVLRFPRVFGPHIDALANQRGIALAKKYLENHGFITCSVCPSRQQLRNVGAFRACPAHYEALLVKTNGHAKGEPVPTK